MVYESFFGLRETPFNLTPDPRFFFFSKQHEEALSHILFGIRERKGFIVITGEVGTGKTTLCRLVLQRTDPTVKTSLLFNANLGTIELLQAINQDFGLPGTGTTKKALVDELNRFLLDGLTRGENALLVIDEAQGLSIEAMEEIRLLSNLETEREKLIQVLMVGQPELREKLARKELRQLNQRITLRYDISPLDLFETQGYIHSRLKAAGSLGSIDWSSGALRAVHRFSGGVPRLINIAADRALLAAYVAGSRLVTDGSVHRGLEELSDASLDQSRGGAPMRQRDRGMFRIFSGALAFLVLAWGAVYFFSLGSGGNHQTDLPPSPALLESFLRVPSPGEEPRPVTGRPEKSDSPAEESDGSSRDKAAPEGSVMKAGFDPEGIYRVGSPEESRAAAFLTLLKLWGRAPAVDEKGFGLKDPVGQWLDSAHLTAYTMVLSTSRVVQFNYPILFLISGNPAPHYVVLAHWGAGNADLLDPLSGVVRVSAEDLERRWAGEEGTLLWEKIAGIDDSLPFRGEPVRRLQEALSSEGLLPRELVDGALGPRTRGALLNFQLREGLNPSGIFSADTHLTLARRIAEAKPPSLVNVLLSPGR